TSVAREYHAGLSAMLGIQAALAARKGYVAEEHVLEMPRGFFAVYGGGHLADVSKDLGTSWDVTTDMAIQLVPGGPRAGAAGAPASGITSRRRRGATPRSREMATATMGRASYSRRRSTARCRGRSIRPT